MSFKTLAVKFIIYKIAYSQIPVPVTQSIHISASIVSVLDMESVPENN